MAVTYFQPATTYTVAGNPSLKLLCVKVTKTFTQFTVVGCDVSNSAVQVGQTIRRRNYGKETGPFVWPLVREAGQPTLTGVTTPPVPPVDPCEPVFTGDVWPSNPPSACLPAMTALGDIVAVGHRTFGGTLVGHTSFYWTIPSDGQYYGLVSVLNPSNDYLRGTGSLTLTGSYTNDTGATINPVAGFINIIGGILLEAGESVKITINGRVCNNIVGPTGGTVQPTYITLPPIVDGQTVAIKLVMEYTLLTHTGQGIPFGLLKF
jgi:hypothetical protein